MPASTEMLFDSIWVIDELDADVVEVSTELANPTAMAPPSSAEPTPTCLHSSSSWHA